MKRRKFTTLLGVGLAGLSGCSKSELEQEILKPKVVEEKIHNKINKIRQRNSVKAINFDKQLADIARSHSKDMAENEFFSHTSPTTGTFEDRYRAAGYDCKINTGANRYVTGSENIAKTWFQKSIETEESITFLEDNADVAEYVVKIWMDSQGHRRNILKNYWENEGIGVAKSIGPDGTEVYVTQNFC